MGAELVSPASAANVTTTAISSASGLASSLVWPIVLCVIVLRFKDKFDNLLECLANLINRIKTISAGGVAVDTAVELATSKISAARSTLAQKVLQAEKNNDANGLLKEIAEKDRDAAVGVWATLHRVPDAWDMGPKNYKKCLFDLALPNGEDSELKYDERTGQLIYQ